MISLKQKPTASITIALLVRMKIERVKHIETKTLTRSLRSVLALLFTAVNRKPHYPN